MEVCHTGDQSNVTSYAATIVTVITCEAFAGIWINAFIISVICMAWIKRKTLNSNEKILLLLACSRVWYLCFSWVYSFLSIIYPPFLYVHPRLQLVVSLQAFFNFSNLWVSVCLCVFYCIKIANFRNNFFIYLKVKIDRIVPWLLLGSLLFSLVIGIVVYDVTNKVHCNINSTGQNSFWKPKIKMDKHFFPSFFLTGFGFAVSFMAIIFSALLLLFSLWRHKRNMQTNSMTDLSMETHIRAMKSILSFLVTYSINFSSLILDMVYATQKGSPAVFLIIVLRYAFPGVHSLILIFSNPKLEKRLLRILPCVKFSICMR